MRTSIIKKATYKFDETVWEEAYHDMWYYPFWINTLLQCPYCGRKKRFAIADPMPNTPEQRLKKRSKEDVVSFLERANKLNLSIFCQDQKCGGEINYVFAENCRLRMQRMGK